MAKTVKVEGLRELERALAEIEKRSTRKAVGRRVLKKAGQPVADLASSLAPDDPLTSAPDLHRAIEVSHRQKSGRQLMRSGESETVVNMYIGPTPEGYPQAIMQEFGTVNHSARPYMRPAWDREQSKTLDRIQKLLWSEIKSAIKRQSRRNAK